MLLRQGVNMADIVVLSRTERMMEAAFTWSRLTFLVVSFAVAARVALGWPFATTASILVLITVGSSLFAYSRLGRGLIAFLGLRQTAKDFLQFIFVSLAYWLIIEYFVGETLVPILKKMAAEEDGLLTGLFLAENRPVVRIFQFLITGSMLMVMWQYAFRDKHRKWVHAVLFFAIFVMGVQVALPMTARVSWDTRPELDERCATAGGIVPCILGEAGGWFKETIGDPSQFFSNISIGKVRDRVELTCNEMGSVSILPGQRRMVLGLPPRDCWTEIVTLPQRANWVKSVSDGHVFEKMLFKEKSPVVVEMKPNFTPYVGSEMPTDLSYRNTGTEYREVVITLSYY